MTDQDPHPRPVPRAGRTPWQHYVDLIRALDAERAAEGARTAKHRQGAEAAALEVERLAPLLIDQGAELSHLARRLRISHTRLSAEPVTSDAGPYELVVQATRMTARAGSCAREAHFLATRARFLPGAPAGVRNFVIYLVWALAGLGVQYAMVLADQQGTKDPAASGQAATTVGVLVLVPLVAYVGALITIGVLGRPLLAVDRPGRSARMGALICFGIFPLGLVVLGLNSLLG